MKKEKDKEIAKEKGKRPNQTANLEQRYQELENKYKRALADYQNLLKQSSRERIDSIKYANEHLLHEILPVYDNLKMSLGHANDDAVSNGWLEGIRYVIKQFRDVLERAGVEEIKTVGWKFDHNTMEAINQEPTEEQAKDGLVAQVVRPGYRLAGKVIIPASVVVYKLKI